MRALSRSLTSGTSPWKATDHGASSPEDTTTTPAASGSAVGAPEAAVPSEPAPLGDCDGAGAGVQAERLIAVPARARAARTRRRMGTARTSAWLSMGPA